MAATTKLLQLRPKTLPLTTPMTPSAASVHLYSSSTTHEPDSTPSPQANPPSQSHSPSPPSMSSFFRDLKASLNQQPPQSLRNHQSQSRRYPFPSASTAIPNKAEVQYEIRKNLGEFRRLSASPPPSSPSALNPSSASSLEELYQRKAPSKGQESNPGACSLSAIRASLGQLGTSTDRSRGGERTNNAMGMGSMVRDMLMTRPLDPNAQPLQKRMFGESDQLPPIFGKEMMEAVRGGATRVWAMTYSPRDLGEKLRALRPERRDKKDWFSLEELTERLVKLRELEEQARNSGLGGSTLSIGLRESIEKWQPQNEPKRAAFDILSTLGRTPSYMLFPPKEELVEKYFHPDHMSAAEKLKLELGKVRDEFKLSDSDCGSARVQVAQLTTKIKHLSTVLHKKDKHSRKGLEAMVQRRKKLLIYLRRTYWDSYCLVLSKLGLRDNQDDYVKKKNYPSKKDHSGKKKKALKH